MFNLARSAALTAPVILAMGTLIAGENNGVYIKVEIKGTLETGIFAIGGETTGTVLHIGNVTWELDVGDNKELQAAVELLHDRTVLVRGVYEKREGVEIPERHIVRVSDLRPCDDNR